MAERWLRRMLRLAPVVVLTACNNPPQEATCIFRSPPEWSPPSVRVDVPIAKAGEDMWGSDGVPDNLLNEVKDKRTVPMVVRVGPSKGFRGEVHIEIYRNDQGNGCAVRKVSVDGKVVQGNPTYPIQEKPSASTLDSNKNHQWQ